MGSARMKNEQINSIVLDLYDAVLDPTRWSNMAESFAKLLEADSASLQAQNTVNGYVQMFSRTSNFSAESLNAYREYYYKKEVLIERAIQRNLTGAVINQDLISDEEWAETEIYRDFLSHQGVFHVAGAVFGTRSDEIGIIAVHRPRHGKPFDDVAKHIINGLVAHAQRAIQLHNRLNMADIDRHGAGEILERSGTTILLVDRAGRLLHATGQGERFLQTSQEMTVVAGRIIATQLSINHQLARAIQTAVDTAAGTVQAPEGILAIPRKDGLPLAVLVAPFAPRTRDFSLLDPAAIIMIRDPSTATPAAAAVREMFGLTPTEAGIAAALVHGKSLQEIAAANGVTFNTVRSQLKAITLKTGAKRQSDLIALILKSISGLVKPARPVDVGVEQGR